MILYWQKTLNFLKDIFSKESILISEKKIIGSIFIVLFIFISGVMYVGVAEAATCTSSQVLTDHASSSNCWIQVKDGTVDKLYNVTSASNHPGGHKSDYINGKCGQIATNFHKSGHGGIAVLNACCYVCDVAAAQSPAPSSGPSPAPSSSPTPAAPATIAFLGDARTTSEEHLDNFGKAASIAMLTDDINKIKPQSPTPGVVDAAFMIGDFDKVVDTQAAWTASTINSMPHYYVIGNHEIDDDNPNYTRNLFPYSGYSFTLNPGPAGTNKTTYSMNIGGIHVVNLNVYWNGGTGTDADIATDGNVPPALLSWLDADLSNSSNPPCKVVMFHEPMYPYGRHTGDSLNKYATNRNNLQKLLVDKKVSAVIAAHTHLATVHNIARDGTVLLDINAPGGVYHIDTGVTGPKTEDGEDDFASIFYAHTSGSNLILTWKRENPTWSSPKVTTYTSACSGTVVSSPAPSSGPIPSDVPIGCIVGVPCDDNNACTSSDTCIAGLCRGTPKNCADSGTGSECTFDSCDPSTGTCTHTDVCGGLVPCGRLVDNPKTGQINEKAPCDLCSAFYMVKNIINFAIQIVFVLAILALVIAGILYSTSFGNQNTIEIAKRAAYNTLIGLFIVFLAWILIAAILQAIGYSSMSTWNQVDCTLFSGELASLPPSLIPSSSPAPSSSSVPTATPNLGICPTFPIYGPTPGSFSVSCTHTLNVAGNTVTAKDSSGTVVSTGTLNKVLSDTAKSGNHVCIQDGTYTLNSITLPEKVFIECLPGASGAKPIVNASLPTAGSRLITLKSDSSIKGCEFKFASLRGNGIYVEGAVKNWSVENNHFINVDGSIRIVNDNASDPPTSGWGSVLNNTGLHSRLGGIQGGRYITFKDNKFYDYTGDEFFDFNGKNPAYDTTNSPNLENTIENNILENVSSGYYLNDEAIDMIGYNNNNIVRNNRIVGNFQRGISPRYEASGNCIEGNYIQFKPGGVNVSANGIPLEGHSSNASRFPANNKINNNRIVGVAKGVYLNRAKNNTVTNNTINATSCGISITSSSSGNTISGNIFLNPSIPQTCN